MKYAPAVVVLAALGLAPLAAHAGVRVSRDGCGPVTVQADNAHLSEVLAALSDVFPLSHRVMKDSDPRLTFTLTGSVDEVVAALTRHRNVILVRHENARCPGERVPKTLWVLDGGEGSKSPVVAVSSRADTAAVGNELFPPEVLARVTPVPRPATEPDDPDSRSNRSESERIVEREAQRARGPGERPVRRRRR